MSSTSRSATGLSTSSVEHHARQERAVAASVSDAGTQRRRQFLTGPEESDGLRVVFHSWTSPAHWASSRTLGVLVTLRKDGRAQSSDVVYAVIDGRICISLTSDRAKTHNMQRDGA